MSTEAVSRADILIEGFGPGGMERLQLGPEDLIARNPRLIYGRVTGWGQQGPLAQSAGHDINFIAITGALHAIGSRNSGPVVPLNLVGDFGAGSMLLISGVLSALYSRERTGKGQVVDAAICDGTALLMAMIQGLQATGHWKNERQSNLLDGGAPYYGTYLCADGKWIAIGPLEPKFLQNLLDELGLDRSRYANPTDAACWAGLRDELANVFRRRTRSQWCELLESRNVCFAPVLDLTEAPQHPHHLARGTYVEMGGITQPAPAPRFSGSPGAIQSGPPRRGAHSGEIRAEVGMADSFNSME